MAEVPAADGALLRHWQILSPPDRRAILAALSPQRRQQFEALLEESGGGHAAARRQYAAYSPWLARLVEACVEGPEHDLSPLPVPVRDALRECHARLLRELGEDLRAPDPRARLRAFARNLLDRSRVGQP